MSFPPSFLDELRARCSLAAIVGRRVRLTKRGRDYVGLCPFHKEKTPLLAESRERPVTRYENDILAERPQLAGDRAEERGLIAARKVAAADRAAEQHVADEREACRLMEEDDM